MLRVCTRVFRGQRDAQLFQDPLAFQPGAPLVQKHPSSHELMGKVNIGRNVEGGNEVELLKDYADPRLLRGDRIGKLPVDAIKEERSLVGLDNAGKYFHESGFPRSVFSHQRVYFACPNSDAHLIEGAYAGP